MQKNALTTSESVGYHRDSVPTSRPFVAFKLIRPDTDGMAYFPATRAVTVAGMVRHAVAEAATATGWDRAKINQFVLGHREKPEDTLPRFSYVPLPSIEPSPRNVVGGIRRVLLAEPLDAAGENIGWARRLLPGQVVTNDAGQPVAYLEHISQEGIDGRYVRRAQTWTTVSPVALPGCDEGKASKTDKLLEKMFRHAGYRIEDVEELEFHRVPFLRGAEDARRYCPGPPHYLAHCTMYHMRIRWKRPTPGPLALGSGRFCGLGLFAAIS